MRATALVAGAAIFNSGDSIDLAIKKLRQSLVDDWLLRSFVLVADAAVQSLRRFFFPSTMIIAECTFGSHILWYDVWSG